MDQRERRKTSRKPIRLAARIDLGTAESWPCQITDFCAEGLYVRYSVETSRQLDRTFATEGASRLAVRFRDPDGKRQYDLYVRVARRIEGAMGLSFLESNPDALASMLMQCGGHGAQDETALQAPSDSVQFVLHQSARAVIQYIKPLMDACFVQMATALEASAQKARSDQRANELISFSGQVQARKRQIWQQMVSNLESPMKPASGAGWWGAELAVVDKGEFEDWLKGRVMVTKADTRYRKELLQLRIRLEALGIANATGHHNPLGPSLVYESFHAGLHQLKAPDYAESICLNVFEQTVLQELGPLYQELNNILIRQGVLPDLDLNKYLSGQAADASSTTPAATPIGNEPEKPGPARHGAEPEKKRSFRSPSRTRQAAFTTVKSLLGALTASTQARDGATAASAPAGDGAVTSWELNRELQELQAEMAASAASEASLRDRVTEKIRQSRGKELDAQQDGTLDVVDQFFRSVIESPKLSEYAQAQIHQLEIPVLKEVMRTPAFFDNTDNPARKVVNQLAQLGVRGSRLNPAIQRRVDELVRDLVTESVQDTGVFQRAAQTLGDLVERQNQAYRRNVERVTAAAEGAQKVESSRSVVTDELDQRLAGRKVPRAVISLLEAGWRELLSLTWIRQGPESQAWQDYLAVIDALLAFAENRESIMSLPELLQLIQDGLATISSNQVPPSHLRDELKQFLVRNPETPPEMVAVPDAQPVRDLRQSLADRDYRSLQRWVNRAQLLQPGDWLMDQTKPDEPQHIRLVWVARGWNRFVFVNYQGMRALELELEELARRMRNGVLVKDSQYEQPLVDESIDRMVSKVYGQLSYASTHDGLTGLPGRREFERLLNQQLARPEDKRSLLRLDLRNFRLLNDTAGYQAGDEALKHVASLLREQLDGEMPLARLQGNEFGLLVPFEHADSTAKGLIAVIETTVFAYGEHSYRLSANVGVVPSLPGLISAERWLKASEQALAAAKHKGEGKVAEYVLSAEGQARQERLAAKIASLGDPDEGRMRLRCQKIIPLHSHTSMVAQYKILISMYDKSGELITGQDFMRMSEQYGRTQAVDRWVIGRMLDWLWVKAPDPRHVGGVCIALSGHSLNDESLLEFIYEKLSEKDAPIERLWFEVTDASVIRDMQAVADFIMEIKELGCRFCLGNLGGGSGSLEAMRLLPVDLVKIDSTFTRQVNLDNTDYAMVQSMVNMAHYTGREVIAGRIESRNVLDTLRKLGVDYAQGFAVEKPRLLDSLA
ncbi:DUF1631 family protein [Marinobacter piscensis]|uniref:DUF1631 family protein n=1 Tax=Marinobacter piscensis TaxID=1562308 RepID=UPI0011A1C901|nr:DUF1631 family protein [Marinobacter piscensis]